MPKNSGAGLLIRNVKPLEHMRKSIALIWLTILLSISCSAEDSGVLKAVSPKFKVFLTDHSAASRKLVAAMSESFTNRIVQLYYFYSNDETRPRALHYYPDETVVGIVIRENQEPCDEYMCLLFEILNSQGEKRFKELAEQAKSRAVSKKDFVREIMRQEFQAVMRVRRLLAELKLSGKEKERIVLFQEVHRLS